MITLVGATSAGGFVSSVTVDLPAGVQDGDRMFMLASANDFPTITARPPGWAVMTEDIIGTDVATYVWTRVADGEPASYTVTWEGSHWHFLNLVVFRGVDSVRSYAVNSTDSAATIDLPVLDAQPGDVLLAYGFHWGEVDKTWAPAGLTTITNLSRAIISAYQVQVGGPTPAYTLVTDTVGHMAATAILLTPKTVPTTQPRFPLTIRTELKLGGEWVDISGDVRDTDPVTISRGRADESATADASTCRLLLNNRHGKYSPRNPNSPYYGMLGRNIPLRVAVMVGDTRIGRFAGEVSEWPLRWDLSGNDVWLPIEASGPLRRLSQGHGPARSALRRFIVARNPVAYWPLTDGASALVASPDVGLYDMGIVVDAPPGTLGVTQSRLDWREGELAPWLEDVARTRRAVGRIAGQVESSSADWALDMVRAGVGGVDRLVAVARRGDTGPSQEWQVRFDAGALDIRVFVRTVLDDASPSAWTQVSSTLVEPRFFTDQLRHVRLEVRDAGVESDWWLYIDGELMDTGTTNGLGRPLPVVSAQYWWDHSSVQDAEHVALGHITVWDASEEAAYPNPLEMVQAMYGHRGERAGVRIHRIAREEGIPLEVVGDLEATPPMGPQYAETPLEVMREAERVDDGMLYESRDEVALVYRTHRSRYNQELSG